MHNQARRWHYLKPNHTTRTPCNWLFWDTETYRTGEPKPGDPARHKMLCYAARACRLEAGRRSRVAESFGQTPDEFWRFVYSRMDKRRPLLAWAHNAQFDLLAAEFPRELEYGRLMVQRVSDGECKDNLFNPKVLWQGIMVLEPGCTIVECVRPSDGAKVIVLDSRNYFRCSLSDLGESVGLPKLTMPSRGALLDEWMVYCERDMTIVEKAILRLVGMVREHDLGCFRYTAPAMALQSFRHRFMRHKILVHCDEQAMKLERKSYFGGSCQVHRVGVVDGPVYALDAQSFYPAIMGHLPMPYHFLGYFQCIHQQNQIEFTPNSWVIAHCQIDSPDVTYPIRRKGRVLLARGQFWTTLHQPELMLAKKRGHLRAIDSYARYKADVLFGPWVKFFWSQRSIARECGNKADETLWKTVLNGLSGKWGQKAPQWLDEQSKTAPFSWGVWHELNRRGGGKRTYRSINWRVQRQRLPGEHVHCAFLPPGDETENTPCVNDESAQSCPAIAGAITSWGRQILRLTREVAGIDNVYYEDTDCLHVNANGYKALMDGGYVKDNTLGLLSLRWIASEAEYRGPKYYRLDDQWTVAGVKKSAREVRDGVWEQSEFSGLAGVCVGNFEPRLFETIVEVDRTRDCILGSIGKDGWVNPITLGASDEY